MESIWRYTAVNLKFSTKAKWGYKVSIGHRTEIMSFMCYNVENIVKDETKVKKFYTIFFTCLMLLCLSACSSSSNETLEDGWYGKGDYEVGTDIPQGEYYFTPKDEYDITGYAVSNRYIEGEDTFYSATWSFYYLEEGDHLHMSESGKFISASEIPPIESRGEGMYRVGVDIPQGTYRLSYTGEGGVGKGYYAVYTATPGFFNDEKLAESRILEEDWFTGEREMKVSNGQYLEVKNCKIETFKKS